MFNKLEEKVEKIHQAIVILDNKDEQTAVRLQGYIAGMHCMLDALNLTEEEYNKLSRTLIECDSSLRK